MNGGCGNSCKITPPVVVKKTHPWECFFCLWHWNFHMKLRSSGVENKLVEGGVVSRIKDGGTPRAFEPIHPSDYLNMFQKWGLQNVPNVFKKLFTFPGDCRAFPEFLRHSLSSWGWLWRKRGIIRVCCLAKQKSNLKEKYQHKMSQKRSFGEKQILAPECGKNKSHWF